MITEEQMRACLLKIQQYAHAEGLTLAEVLNSLEKFLQYRRKARKELVT